MQFGYFYFYSNNRNGIDYRGFYSSLIMLNDNSSHATRAHKILFKVKVTFCKIQIKPSKLMVVMGNVFEGKFQKHCSMKLMFKNLEYFTIQAKRLFFG